MSGLFTVLNDYSAGMYRVRRASQYEEREGPATLSDKMEDGMSAYRLDPEFLRGAQSAMAAMEEARRIAGPKAAAEQRLQEAERRIAEIRQEARIAAARGDREKLAQLAREAALLARKAGKAAGEFSIGVSAAAALGKGAGSEITTSVQVSQTTLTLQQTEAVVQVTLSGDAAAALASSEIGAAQVAAAQGTIPPATASPGPKLGGEDAMATDAEALLAQAGEVLNALDGGAASGQSGDDLVQSMVGDNALKMQRWKEADTFGRRVEGVLHHAKAIINEAKRANDTDENLDRRKARRKELEAYGKVVDEAQKATNDLRSAAFGSSIGPEQIVEALTSSEPASAGTAATGTASMGVAPMVSAVTNASAALNLIA